MSLIEGYLNKLFREKMTERYKDKVVPWRIMDGRMRLRRYYCHKCGDRLIKHPYTRIIRRGDKEWNQYFRSNNFEFYTQMALTECEFLCQSCNRVIPREEQYKISVIQRKLKKHLLAESEIISHLKSVKAVFASQYLFMRTVKKVLIAIAVVAVIVGLVLLELLR